LSVSIRLALSFQTETIILHGGNIPSPGSSNHAVQFSALLTNYAYYQTSTEIFGFCRYL